MKINIRRLTLTKVFELSQFIKESCKGITTLEDAAQELVAILCKSLVTDSGESAVVLNRFFKSCSYVDLPHDIQEYIKQKEGRDVISQQEKFLTLLGTWGDEEDWKHREASMNYKAFSLNDKNVLYQFPMLSAVFNQIGFKISTMSTVHKSIIIDKQDSDYGVFYVNYAKDSKLIPRQSEFVVPYGVKSVFGFGGHYVSNNIYSVILFCREHISEDIVRLFLSLNPVIKLLTLKHEITGCIFNTEVSRKIGKSLPSETCAEMKDSYPIQNIEYFIKCQEALAITDEVKKANEALVVVTNELKEKNRELIKEITARKQMEEALIQSEKLKSMGVMTAGISHEFNNILAIIKGFAFLLNQKYGDIKEVNDKTNAILKSVADGTGIVSRMQDFTRSEVDRTEFEPVDISDLVEQVIEFSMPRWKTISEANGVFYKIDKKGLKTVPVVEGNKTELRQVILNIINNSLDAMAEGGNLSFRTWLNDDKVFLSITDTGEGMSKEIRNNIFDPFLTTRMPKGAGLGMSVSYGIIKRHSGEIFVKSEVGKGTSTTIQLPICKAPKYIDTKPKPIHKLEVTKLHILIVDDEKAVGEFLGEYFSQEGHTVKNVYRGKDAIKLLHSESFDLVLCDLVMPEVGGREVIKMLNTLEKRPKAGLITGWFNNIYNTNSEDFNVDFILKKPFDFSEISKQINNLFSVTNKNP
ncbi:MAG: hybrid sensor histidine kinase/response regulator [Candidatus Scalindua sp. SCAELEC01]|nr:MAG: hybrid sensor histidine kinase/response regulator [Candidatus Scalindua sp. SCAELEC01]